MKIFKKTDFTKISFLFIAGLSFFGLFSEAKQFSFLSTPEDTSRIIRNDSLTFIQGNSIVPISLLPEPKVVRKINVITSAYTSLEWQTDSTPFITASGSRTRFGIVANNGLLFGTRIRMPEIYGDKIFVVEDRMHSRKGDFHVDVWLPTNTEAVNYGVKFTYIEVLKN